MEDMTTQMGLIYDAMTRDMRGKLSGYYGNLQRQYGDPRMIHEQEQQVQQQVARVEHKQMSHTSELLRDAYAKKTVDNRNKHNDRMSKRQVGRTAASPPECEASVDPGQTAPRRKRPSPRQPQARPSAS